MSSCFAEGSYFLCVPKTDFCQIAENKRQIRVQFQSLSRTSWLEQPGLEMHLSSQNLAALPGGTDRPLVVSSCKDANFPPLGHYAVWQKIPKEYMKNKHVFFFTFWAS